MSGEAKAQQEAVDSKALAQVKPEEHGEVLHMFRAPKAVTDKDYREAMTCFCMPWFWKYYYENRDKRYLVCTNGVLFVPAGNMAAKEPSFTAWADVYEVKLIGEVVNLLLNEHGRDYIRMVAHVPIPDSMTGDQLFKIINDLFQASKAPLVQASVLARFFVALESNPEDKRVVRADLNSTIQGFLDEVGQVFETKFDESFAGLYLLKTNTRVSSIADLEASDEVLVKVNAGTGKN